MILITLFYILSVSALAMSVIYFKLMFESVQVRSQKICDGQNKQLSIQNTGKDIDQLIRMEEEVFERICHDLKFNEREVVNEL